MCADCNGLMRVCVFVADAYFTKLTEGQLRTIDDVPELRDLDVPEGIFRSARTTKPGKRGEGSRTATSSVKRLYAPFPNQPTRRVRSLESPPPVHIPVVAGPSSSMSPVAVAAPDAMVHQQQEQQQQQTGSISLHQPFPPPAPSFYPEVNWYF